MDDIRRGVGGGFSAAACCLALAASWESDALRNRSMENRRCLEDSSWIGGDTGRSNASAVDVVTRLDVEDMPSFGGVIGGAGTTTRAGALDSGTGERGEVKEDGGASTVCSSRDGGRFVGKRGKLWNFVVLPRSVSLCLRISESLAMTPRRRRNGMMWTITCGGVVDRRNFPSFDRVRSRVISLSWRPPFPVVSEPAESLMKTQYS